MADSSPHLSQPPILINRATPSNHVISSPVVNTSGEGNVAIASQLAPQAQTVQFTTLAPAWQQRFVLLFQIFHYYYQYVLKRFRQQKCMDCQATEYFLTIRLFLTYLDEFFNVLIEIRQFLCHSCKEIHSQFLPMSLYAVYTLFY